VGVFDIITMGFGWLSTPLAFAKSQIDSTSSSSSSSIISSSVSIAGY
jgi:hypothetical protein